MKPALAEDAIVHLTTFPCYVQPKIDGVRALFIKDTLTGRSLDPFKGTGITEYFSDPDHKWLDGEMTLGTKPNCTERLCAATTGAMGRFKDTPEMADLHWWIFDCLEHPDLPYKHRFAQAVELVDTLNDPRIHWVPYTMECHNAEELKQAIAWCYEQGFEGAMIKNPEAPHKDGRATQKGQQMWRIKPWLDSEILVTGITQGNHNANEAKKNTLGRTERSSSKDGMVPNGMVGSIQGVLLADVICPMTGKLLFVKGTEITVGPGEMTAKEAKHYWENPSEIVDHLVKFKHMTHGVKDKPRFPTYISHRLKEDMVYPQ